MPLFPDTQDGKLGTPGAGSSFTGGMIKIVNFRCPDTGKRAAAVVPDMPEPEASDSSSREVLCPACGWFHRVEVGKMAADDQSALFNTAPRVAGQ